MKFISENTISEESVNSFDEKMTLKLATRPEEDNYEIPFDRLKELNLLRPLTLNRLDLKSNYIHPLDKELFDEN
tara:strand:- start:60 stop:281 length:222 start_codon:yes stop_codon:yes gene_type:complete